MMNVYDQQLEKEPGDYATRFARSYQYFYNGQIDEALADITKTITDCPEQDREVLYDALLLRAKIYDKKNELDSEFADLKSAFCHQFLKSECNRHDCEIGAQAWRLRYG
ncbi:MAG: hypothetical protein L6U16_13805 [Porphyromonadaceae bacterium]|nr:MAG: hypothetical protein L6U16_13805 [Porphyromonadaceae bacterium]